MYLLAEYKDKSVAIFHVEYIEYSIEDEFLYFDTTDCCSFKINIPRFKQSYAYNIIETLFTKGKFNIIDKYGNMFVEVDNEKD